MAKRWREANRPARRRGRTVAVEALEGRLLLSAVPAAPTVGAVAHVTPIVVAHPASRHQVKPPWSPGGRPDPTFHGRLKFVTDTWKQSHALAYSHDVIKAGWHYTRLTFSHDTAKVGLAYLKAVIRGNSKEIHHLNKTDLVNKVGSDYTALGRTNVVRHVGQAFSRFGHSVSKQFNRLFTKHPHKHP
jgi:hypothetical protein